MTDIDHAEIVQAAASEEHHERLVAVLIILVTLCGAVVAFLQTQAGNRESKADRNAQQASVATMGALVETSRKNQIESQAYDELNDLDWAGFEFETVEQRGDAATSFAGALGRANREASRQVARYRAGLFGEKHRNGDEFDYVGFLEDEWKPFYRSSELQKAGARERDGWGDKSDRFVTVITVFAVALFLLGLSLTVPGRAQTLFLWVGSFVGAAAAVWGVIVFSGDVAKPNRTAIDAYVEAQVRSDFADTSGDEKRAKKTHEEVVDYASRAIRARDDYTEAYLARSGAYFALDFLRKDGPRGSYPARDDLLRATDLDPDNYVSWGNLGAAQFWLDDYRGALRSTEKALELQPRDAVFNMNRALVLSILGDEEEYADQLADVRSVLANEPSWIRNSALQRYRSVFTLGAKYRPLIAPGMVRFRDDLHRIDRQIAVGLRVTGDPTPKPIEARMAKVTFEPSRDGSQLRVNFDYTGLERKAKYEYETAVDGVFDRSFGPFAWKLDVPSGAAFIMLDRQESWRPGSQLEVDFFVSGRLAGYGTYTIPAK